MSAQEKAQGFLGANERLVTAYESLDATARQEVQVKLAFLPFPADVALLSGMRMNETALHGWDARVAFDPYAALTVEAIARSMAEATGGRLVLAQRSPATFRVFLPGDRVHAGQPIGFAAD